MKPRIISRSEHRISRKLVSSNALRALYRLHQNGFRAYLVGGCVRDLLLERTPKDFDIVTDATPGQIRRLFRNCRLIGRRFRLAHLHFQNEIIEVATFRRPARTFESSDGKETVSKTHRFCHIRDADGMVLRDNLFGTPEDDALSRDFTINALFYNIADFSVIDYSTGLTDLTQRLIRPIGDPYTRFTEDPVRMLRAVRFAASHDFHIEPDAWEAIREHSSTISRVDTSRLYEEIRKTFLFGFACPAFRLLDKCGLLAALFPGLYQWVHRNSNHSVFLQTNLESLDRIYRNSASLSPALFFTSLFGPFLEEETLVREHDGISHQLALDAACTHFMEDIRTIINVPRRAGSQLRAILALQDSLRKMPPRRPAFLVGKPEFADALTYLRITSTSGRENRIIPEWWDAFLSRTSPPIPQEQPAERTKKKRKRRKYKSRNRTLFDTEIDGQQELHRV